MKISIKGSQKEIAALVLAIQGRQETTGIVLETNPAINQISNSIRSDIENIKKSQLYH